MKTIAIISIQAFSLVNFRGEPIAALLKSGIRVFAHSPDYDETLRQRWRGI